MDVMEVCRDVAHLLSRITSVRRQLPSPSAASIALDFLINDPAAFMLVGLLLAVLGVVLLNLADAFFTLLFLAHGGQEMNPIVDQVLAYGPHVFILFKTLGIGVCAGFLTLTKNFRAARIGLWIVLIGYSLLLCWHLLLLATLFF
jgi:hypothetical protein